MGTFKKNGDGSFDDRVTLELNGREVLLAENYDVSIAYLLQPNAFSITLGSGATALSITKAFPAGTRFGLRVGDVVQFTGRTDGFEKTSQTATEIAIKGRDCMARLIDDDVEHDESVTHATWEELARKAIEGAQVKGYSLVFDTAAHRQAVVGTPIVETIEATVGAFVGPVALTVGSGLNYSLLAREDTTTITRIKGYRAERPIEIKAGTSHHGWLKKENDRGGLFLRAGVDPTGEDEFVFLLGAPSANQAPVYALINQRGAARQANFVNVFAPKLHDVTLTRRAHFIVYGKAGTGKGGRNTIIGRFDDEEMIALGFTTRKVHIDKEVKSSEHATYLARKLCAEARRQDRSFTYAIKGHTLPLIAAPERRGIPAPDTCIYIKDDEHGIEGVFWIERVSHRGSSEGGRTTEITVMVPEDLVFGDGEFARGGKKKKRSKVFGRY
jgi:prophage tail gpP-like protein